MKKNSNESILIIDIETTSINASRAEFKFGGYYSYLTDEIGVTQDIKTYANLIRNHDYIVTFNGKKYDHIVLERYGIDFRGKILIDLYEVLADRFPYHGKGKGKLINPNFNKFGLDDCLKTLGIPNKKLDFDYALFKQDSWTKEELQRIVDYTEQDIKVTKELYEFLDDFFSSFKEYLSEDDIRRKAHIIASGGALAYKIVCKIAGLPESYDGEGKKSEFKGAFVALPTKDSESGNIYCLDFTSLYPHMDMMGNLFTPSTECSCKVNGKCLNPWSGRGIYKLKGTYCGCKLGKIENAIKHIFLERLKFKGVDKARYQRNKIVINTVYGLSALPSFSSIWNPTVAEDCTRMGRQTLKYTRKRFLHEGYDVLYSDTDSCYIKDPFNDKERLLGLAKKIIKEVLDCVPFPMKTFGLDLDYEITNIWFFKDEKDITKYKKKHYIFIYKDYNKKTGLWSPKLVIKGLPIKKRNATRLSKKIFDERLKPEILVGRRIEFPRDLIMRYIEYEINKDYQQLGTIFSVNSIDEYKNPNQIQAQIGRYVPEGRGEPLGEGRHTLIKNYVRGIGVGESKYCTIEEAADFKFHHFDLSQLLKELQPFIKEDKQLTLGGWFGDK